MNNIAGWIDAISLRGAAVIELAEGHLALDLLGSPREIQNGDIIRECLIAERIALIEQPARDELIAKLQYEAGMYRSLYEAAVSSRESK